MYTAGKLAGRMLRGKRTAKPGEKMAGTTVVAKGGEQAVISLATIVAVIGALRAWHPEWLPWTAEEDYEVGGRIVVLITGLAWAVGSLRNVWRNRHLLPEGVSVKKTVVLLLCVGLLGGCAITTPKGVYSIALTGDQVGFAKDVIAQVGNLYQEIEAQEAALEEAQKQGKTDRVAAILEKIAGLKEKVGKKEKAVEAVRDEAEAALEASSDE